MTEEIMVFEEEVQDKDKCTFISGSSASKHAPSDIRSTMDVDPHPSNSSKIAKGNSMVVDVVNDDTILTQSPNVTSKFKSPKNIFKVANKTNQRLFLSFLRSSSLHIDILCLQEVSAFHSQHSLTEEQQLYFQHFLFPNRSSVATKYTAIICLNNNLQLKDEVVSRDQRSIATHIINSSGDTVASIINIYAPASSTERSLFFTSFPDLPFLNYITTDFPGFILGYFNMSLPSTTGTADWKDWISTNFFNCFPAGSTN
ncbi:hypothetical protein BD770DRAFT_446075 [Pilaira anomala]|nr:hypothetical protein BD770DRAFT_446075 [Pilaira anomala]